MRPVTIYPIDNARTDWRCLYCDHPVEPGVDCPMPDCVEKRAAARRRMGMEG